MKAEPHPAVAHLTFLACTFEWMPGCDANMDDVTPILERMFGVAGECVRVIGRHFAISGLAGEYRVTEVTVQ